jgi:hypothetical protein
MSRSTTPRTCPAPAVIAEEIVELLADALEQFQAVAAQLGPRAAKAPRCFLTNRVTSEGDPYAERLGAVRPPKPDAIRQRRGLGVLAQSRRLTLRLCPRNLQGSATQCRSNS